MVSDRRNDCMSSGSSPRIASRSVCSNARRRNSVWTSWSSSKDSNSSRKVGMIVYVGVGIAHLYFVLNLSAVNKDELMETITVGAEKIINTNDE